MSDTKKKSKKNSVSENKNDSVKENNIIKEEKSETAEIYENIPEQVKEGKDNENEAAAVQESSDALKLSLFARIQNAAQSSAQAVYDFAFRHNIFARFIGIYLIISAVFIIINRNKDNSPDLFRDWQSYCENSSLKLIMVLAAAAFILITVLKEKVQKVRELNVDGVLIAAGSVLFGASSVWRRDDYWYAAAVIAVMAVLITIFIKHEDFKILTKLNSRVYFIAVIALAAGVISFIAYLSIRQFNCFYDSTFDMGIFIQMYHSLVTKFSFVTTCERNKLLSHFAVHTSPAYLMLVPFYFFFRKAETLLIAQAVLAISGVIPLWFICRKYKFSNAGSFMMCVVFIFSSSLISPCFYDFHENVFLPSFLMWFFYAIEKDKHVLMYIMMVLVLSVKEDASLYVMCIGLYLLISGRKRSHGLIIFLLSAAYFFTVTSLMGKYGEGVMTSRTYGNLMTNWDGGFGNVIGTVLSNPAYFISECIKEEKIKFILVMLLPLLFVPFATKKASRLILVVPFILMNLATGYPYAFNQGYQYVFGTTACLMYVSVMNLSDFKKENFRSVLSVMAAASVITSVCIDSGKIYFHDLYNDLEDRYVMMEACLDTIPEDASVLATTWYVPYLANRDEIYMFEDSMASDPDTCDFVVLPEDNHGDPMETKREVLRSEGYIVYCSNPNGVEVFVSPDYLKKLKQ